MTEIVFQIIILIMSAVVHEVAHGYAAFRLGDSTAKNMGRLTLNPLKHLDPFGSVILPALLALFNSGFIFGWAKPVPFNPYNLRSAKWGEALVAIAGPVSNILIALIFGLTLRFGLGYGFLSGPAADITAMIVFINLLLAIFNLVPIPPLDGSKILFAFLPYHLKHIRNFLERYSLILFLIFVFFLWDFVAPLVYVLFLLITSYGL